MKLSQCLLPAFLGAAILPATAATVTYHGEGYTLQYETGTDFSGFHAAASGANRSFGWGSANMSVWNSPRVGGASGYDLRTYALPTLTVTADPGRVLSGLAVSFHGAVLDWGIKALYWDAFLFDYRFKVGGADRSLAASLTPPAGTVTGIRDYTPWTLTERYAGPPGFSSFSLRGDFALVLIGTGDLTEATATSFLDVPTTGDNLLQFDFRVDPAALATGVPTGATAPVPEPETWATMLAGLGLLGLAARCRRPATHPSSGE